MQSNFRAEVDLGYQQFAAGAIDAATALTIPAGCAMVTMVPSAQAIRWRSDGVNPTTAVGYPLAAGAELRYTANRAAAIRVIAQVAGAVLDVYYWG